MRAAPGAVLAQCCSTFVFKWELVNPTSHGRLLSAYNLLNADISRKFIISRKSAQPVLLLPEWRHGASHRGRSRPEADGQEAALLRGLGIHPESCKHFLQDLLNKPIDGGIVET